MQRRLFIKTTVKMIAKHYGRSYTRHRQTKNLSNPYLLSLVDWDERRQTQGRLPKLFTFFLYF